MKHGRCRWTLSSQLSSHRARRRLTSANTMSSFLELARRALNNTSTAAAVGLFAITVQQHSETTRDGNKSRARCDALHQKLPFQRLDRQTSHLERTWPTQPITLDKTKRADELHSTYKVDWKTVLGEGAYGQVYPARHRGSGEKVICSAHISHFILLMIIRSHKTILVHCKRWHSKRFPSDTLILRPFVQRRMHC
jgi:hypothetical protein